MDYKQIDSFEKVLEFKGETLEQFQQRTKGMDVDTERILRVSLRD